MEALIGLVMVAAFLGGALLLGRTAVELVEDYPWLLLVVLSVTLVWGLLAA